MTKSFVYWLYNNTCGLIEETGYVGVSIHPKKRHKEHLWADRVPADSFMSILFEGTRAECDAKELELRPEASIGWNVARGGANGYKFEKTTQTREKISESNKGKVRTKETLMRMSAAQIGKTHSKVSIDRMRAAQSSRSKETLDKLSKSHMGKTHSKEARARMSLAKSGKNNPKFIDLYCVGCKKKSTPSNLPRSHARCFTKFENSPNLT